MKWLDPNAFDWNEAPLSSLKEVSIASGTYLCLVVLCTIGSYRFLPPTTNNSKKEGKDGLTSYQWRPWFFNSDLKHVQTVHNINLVLLSAVMLIGSLIETVRRINNNNDGWPPFLLCETTTTTAAASGGLYYWSYMYYLSKYYEFFDTFLQLARGKPPPNFVLHVYHHAAVVFMAWAWIETKQSLQFIGLYFNTAVHIVMYSYFLQRTLTQTIPKWKSLVTMFQIVQFAFSLICFVLTLYIHYVQGHECSGMKALYGNVLFNITLLHSFVGVLFSNNKKKKKQQ